MPSCMVPQRGPKVLVTCAPGTGLVHFGCGAAIAASSSLANCAPVLPATGGAPGTLPDPEVTMRRSRVIAALAVLLGGMLAAVAPALSASAATSPYCGITWGSLVKSGGAMTQTPLLTVRTGQHDCWDRVV